MEKPTNHELRLAQDAVDSFKEGNLLGKNTKLLEDGETYQIRIGAELRVQFVIENGEKEIVGVFKKGNHTSHR